LIVYFIGDISATKYQNTFMCVKVIASKWWDVFLRHGVSVRASALASAVAYQADVPLPSCRGKFYSCLVACGEGECI